MSDSFTYRIIGNIQRCGEKPSSAAVMFRYYFSHVGRRIARCGDRPLLSNVVSVCFSFDGNGFLFLFTGESLLHQLSIFAVIIYVTDNSFCCYFYMFSQL